MTDPKEGVPIDGGEQTVENGGIGLDGDAAGAAIGTDLDGAGKIASDEGSDGETMADKAALVDADSILDPVAPENGIPPR